MDPDDVAGALAALGHPVCLRLPQAVLRGRRGASELGGVEGLKISGPLYHHLRERPPGSSDQPGGAITRCPRLASCLCSQPWPRR